MNFWHSMQTGPNLKLKEFVLDKSFLAYYVRTILCLKHWYFHIANMEEKELNFTKSFLDMFCLFFFNLNNLGNDL